MAPRILSTPSLPRARTGVIVWVFVAIIVTLLALTLYSTQLLSSGRIFVASVNHWSKAHRDAAFYLTRYAETKDAEDYLAFQSAMGVLEGVRAARDELAKPTPDRDAVRAQLRTAGVTDQEVDDLTFLAHQLA